MIYFTYSSITVPKQKWSVQESEEPEGYFVSTSNGRVCIDNITIWDVSYLYEALAFSADLESPFAIDDKVTNACVGNGVFLSDLIEEKGFTLHACVHTRNKGVHQRGVVNIDFLWL